LKFTFSEFTFQKKFIFALVLLYRYLFGIPTLIEKLLWAGFSGIIGPGLT